MKKVRVSRSGEVNDLFSCVRIFLEKKWATSAIPQSSLSHPSVIPQSSLSHRSVIPQSSLSHPQSSSVNSSHVMLLAPNDFLSVFWSVGQGQGTKPNRNYGFGEKTASFSSWSCSPPRDSKISKKYQLAPSTTSLSTIGTRNCPRL